MSTFSLSMLTILISALSIALLIKSDTKRHRKTDNLFPLSSKIRKTLGWTSLLPCALCLVLANYTALLIWLGAVTVIGWLLAMLPARII